MGRVLHSRVKNFEHLLRAVFNHPTYASRFRQNPIQHMQSNCCSGDLRQSQWPCAILSVIWRARIEFDWSTCGEGEELFGDTSIQCADDPSHSGASPRKANLMESSSAHRFLVRIPENSS